MKAFSLSLAALALTAALASAQPCGATGCATASASASARGPVLPRLLPGRSAFFAPPAGVATTSRSVSRTRATVGFRRTPVRNAAGFVVGFVLRPFGAGCR